MFVLLALRNSVRVSLRHFVRRLARRLRPAPDVRVAADPRPDFAALVAGELAAELPDEDLGQDLDDCLDRYEFGSKPRCEEIEYLELVQDAIDRIERGR
ncbi:hypothetical protein ACH427_10395 [Streptomyces sp. NPDC020379]|uniref:hypothetical protein n=1 Tax=Streptomyces sp. NPDC020379 TaxID=3365071 RepID=UPI003796F9A3